MHPLVYICSPFKGNTETNAANAREYCRLAYDKGYIPIAPHLYFPQFTDEETPEEREFGIVLGLKLLTFCEEIWVFGDVSAGMTREIMLAQALRLPIVYQGSCNQTTYHREATHEE